MEQPIGLHPEAEGLARLQAPPAEVMVNIREFHPEYEDEDKRFPVIAQVPAWLHPLTPSERNHIRAMAAVAYRFWMANGGEKENARAAVESVTIRYTAYFSLRRGPEKGSTRWFSNQDEVTAYSWEQDFVLWQDAYFEAFMPTEAEWGNCWRARSSGTLSALPAIFPAPVPSGVSSAS